MRVFSNVVASAGLALILWAAWSVAFEVGAVLTGALLIAVGEKMDTE